MRNVVVTHAMLKPIQMTIPQMQQAAAQGAYIEFVYNALIGPNKEFDFADYAKAIRAVGVAHCDPPERSWPGVKSSASRRTGSVLRRPEEGGIHAGGD